MANAVVELRDVRVEYGKATVLDLPSFDLRQGEIVAIVGANGAGKSTLLRVIGLLERPTCGSVRYDGEPSTPQNSLRLRRRMASVLQTPLLLDSTVYANAALGLKVRGVNRDLIQARLEPWLDRLSLTHLAKRRARTLSGGEARRTCLARALVLDPELLLLDEPFSALDAPSREALLLDLQKILHQTNAAVVTVTHDIYEAASLGMRIGILSRGRLLQIAPPEEIFNRPVNEEVSRIVAAQNRLAAVRAQFAPGDAPLRVAAENRKRN